MSASIIYNLDTLRFVSGKAIGVAERSCSEGALGERGGPSGQPTELDASGSGLWRLSLLCHFSSSFSHPGSRRRILESTNH